MRDMYEKLNHLIMVREYMHEDVFKSAVASVLANHYLSMMNKQGKDMMRSKMLERVNLTLRSIGVDEVSYGFMRSFF
jgi:hypothetical protein